jgi:hypothetical protein
MATDKYPKIELSGHVSLLVYTAKKNIASTSFSRLHWNENDKPIQIAVTESAGGHAQLSCATLSPLLLHLK